MGCCGEKRSAWRERETGGPAARPPAGAADPTRLRFRVRFEYLGRTGLTVQGPVSGKTYRFDGPGATVEVDLRDRPSLASIPSLRQLPG